MNRRIARKIEKRKLNPKKRRPIRFVVTSVGDHELCIAPVIVSLKAFRRG